MTRNVSEPKPLNKKNGRPHSLVMPEIQAITKAALLFVTRV